MATQEQETAQRQELATALSELAKINPKDLVRDDVLGRDLNFAAGLPYFARTLKLFRDLAESNLDTVPFRQLQQLTSVANQAKNFFVQVQSFSLQQYPNNPTQTRDTFIAQIRDSYDDHYAYIAPVIAYSVRKGTDFERLEIEARQAVEDLKSKVADQEQSRLTMLGEIEGTLEKVRRAAQEAGVAQHAVHFKQEAEEHKKAAMRWLWATGLLAVVTVLTGLINIFLYVGMLPQLGPSESIQLGLAKLIVFAVLFSALLWSGRIYRAHRHNYVVNKHRQNALSTFETFAKAAGSDLQTKSAVLLQATQCIFSPQHSGYFARESEAAGYTQVMEIIRGMAGPPK